MGSNYAAPNGHTLSARAVTDSITSVMNAVPEYMSNAANRVRSTATDTSDRMRDAMESTGENVTSFLRNSGSSALDFGSGSIKPVENMVKSGTQAARRLSSLYTDLFSQISNSWMP